MATGEGDGRVDVAAELPVVGSVGVLADGALVVGGRRGNVAGADGAEEIEFGDGGVEIFAEELGHGGAWLVSVLRSQLYSVKRPGIIELKETNSYAASPRR